MIEKKNNSFNQYKPITPPPVFQGDMETPPLLHLVIGEQHNSSGEQIKEPEWTVLKEKELYQGTCILGFPGQGKTNGSIDFILEQLITRPERIGGFLCDPKSTFYRMAMRHAKTVNRQHDIMGIGVQHNNSFNPFYLPDKTSEYIIDTVMKSIGCLSGGYEIREQFWIQSAYEVLVNLLSMCRLMKIYPTADILYELSTNQKTLERNIEKMSLYYNIIVVEILKMGSFKIWQEKRNSKMCISSE